MDPVRKTESYLRQAEKCIALAKEATSNKMRAHHYATADRYLRLAEAESMVFRIAAKFRSPRLGPANRLSRIYTGGAPALRRVP